MNKKPTLTSRLKATIEKLVLPNDGVVFIDDYNKRFMFETSSTLLSDTQDCGHGHYFVIVEEDEQQDIHTSISN